MSLKHDPEWAKAVAPMMAAAASIPPAAVHDIQARRDRVAGLFGSLVGAMPDAPEVEQTTHTTKTKDGAEITIYRFAKKGSTSTPGPAILHCHGGGMIAGSVPMLGKAVALECQATGVQTFSVGYRLAPENPTPVEDCYAGLVWLYDHVKEFNVDPNRIAVAGESAGGGLAAGIAIMARDNKLSPPLAKQILVYPMLDHRSTKRDPALEPFLIWSVDDNITGWTAMLGDKIGTDDVSPYVSPARVKSVEGLPSAYIDTGDLDLFRDEDIAYAARLAAANIQVELHIYPGVPHAFEAIGPETDVAKKAMANRLKAKMTF